MTHATEFESAGVGRLKHWLQRICVSFFDIPTGKLNPGPKPKRLEGRPTGPPVRNFDWGGGGRHFPRGDYLSQIQLIFIFSRKIRILSL